MSQMLPEVVHKALTIAAQAHEGQKRKGDDLSFIIHPVAVAMMLMKTGADDETVAAALVHDVLEDTYYPADKLAKELGDKVYQTVLSVTNQKGIPWKEKKQNYIESVRNGSPEAQAVALADKIHNMKSLFEAFSKDGNLIWRRFNATREEKKWFEEEMLKVFKATLRKHPLVAEYESQVTNYPHCSEITRFGPKDGKPKASILYVEDDFFLADIYMTKFGQAGIGGAMVSDGIAAWELAQVEQFDLILTGIMMPWRDGLQLLTDLKANAKTKEIPVIMISNLSADFVIEESRKIGAVDYIVMSDITPREVIARIEQYFVKRDSITKVKKKTRIKSARAPELVKDNKADQSSSTDPEGPQTFDEFYEMIVQTLLKGTEKQRNTVWRLLNEGKGDWVWAKGKLLTDTLRSANAKEKEEFCLIGINRHLKAGTAIQVDEDFIDPETNIKYRQYRFSNGRPYRIPYVTEDMDKYAFDTAINKHFLGEYMEMTSAVPGDVELILLDTQELVDDCNKGDFFKKHRPGSYTVLKKYPIT